MSGYEAPGQPPRRSMTARVLRWLPFLAVILEIVVFVAVGRWIGFGWALLILIGSGGLGLAALRFVGLSTWRRLREQAVSPNPDAAAARDALAGVGVRILGAFLLIAPGFVSSVVGVLLLVPPVGRLISRYLPRTVIAGSLWRAGDVRRGPGPGSQTDSESGAPSGSGPVVVAGEVVDVEEVDVERADPPDRSASDYRDAISLDEGRDE